MRIDCYCMVVLLQSAKQWFLCDDAVELHHLNTVRIEIAETWEASAFDSPKILVASSEQYTVKT